jgi:methyltransferase-like protein 6
MERDEILIGQERTLTEFELTKLYKNQARNWDIFYKTNTTNFFKDRHWTNLEFPDLLQTGIERTLFEVGCGVGNTFYPLIKQNKDFKCVYCCDFSKRAIDFVKQSSEYDPAMINAFVFDITQGDILEFVPKESIDVLTCVFVLSAIPPEKIDYCVGQLSLVLKKGGVLLLRDYGKYDQAQLRFKKENYVKDNLYARHDGTFSFFFTKEFIVEKFKEFFDVQVDYVEKTVVNRKRALQMKRIFVQGRLVKK